MQDVHGGKDGMASRISFDEHGVGGAASWGESALALAAADRHADGEPPTVRSARWRPRADEAGAAPEGHAAPPPSAISPVAPCRVMGTPEGDLSVDVAFEDDEPCPATLRSPVASDVSPSDRRARRA